MNARILSILFILTSGILVGQLTIRVDAIPSDTPENAQIYVAGNFQGWNPADPFYELMLGTDGVYSLTFEPSPGNLNFKFTRGSWDTVEGNASGGFLPDRSFNYSGGEVELTLQILSWENSGSGTSTAADNVSVISSEYYIPQLDRYRRIWIYLPPDYDSTEEYYPVMYMQDGQNVFDALTSFAGEWEVDETLNELYTQGDPGIIVVAIDNGGSHRIDEYSPWINTEYGGGEGDAYMQFIINTLKPDIDLTYRTKPQREFTGLMGSSLGGLISHYGGIAYEETFSRIGIFSPSYWFASESFTIVEETPHEDAMRIYIIAGETEGGDIANNAEFMAETLLNEGYSPDEVYIEIHPDGQHSEWYWAREFGAAYQWLFAEVLSLDDNQWPGLSLYPNPTSGLLRIEGLLGADRVEVLDSLGRILREFGPLTSNFTIDELDSGSYLLRAFTAEGKQQTWPFVIE
jgi:predicted alpha/beta superfamily hydrolase